MKLPKLVHKHTGKFIPEWKRPEVAEMMDLISATTVKMVLSCDLIGITELEARTKVYFELLAKACGVETREGVQYLPAPDGEILEVTITDAEAEQIVSEVQRRAAEVRRNASLN